MRDSVRCCCHRRAGEVILKIASATAACSLRSARFEVGRPSRSLGIPRQARASNSRTWSGAPSRTNHCQIGISEVRRIWPGRVGALPSTRNGSSGRNNSRADRCGTPRPSSSLRAGAAHRPRAAHHLAQLFEHEGGNGDVLAAFDRALELPHQQRLRLRRKLPEIVPQPLDRCLAHAPDVHVLARTAKARPPETTNRGARVKKSFRNERRQVGH